VYSPLFSLSLSVICTICSTYLIFLRLTLILLTWRKWWAPNMAGGT
jgi:hypothetical protein